MAEKFDVRLARERAAEKKVEEEGVQVAVAVFHANVDKMHQMIALGAIKGVALVRDMGAFAVAISAANKKK